ncbi:MAG: GNAT family N-acetyltransferase [Candidatus Schekmanbacteria bacterium]|nr:GNAT family N-acetyltransferase [Candidatus Schekmanbacteria bacterium]
MPAPKPDHLPEVAPADIAVRAARDTDAAALIALISTVWSEYPGCVMDIDGEVPELRCIASAFARVHGEFWIAEDRTGLVTGCVGWRPAAAPDGIELCKLYVARAARRRGLGKRLCDLVEAAAVRVEARHVELWSDTRFGDAHRLYERLGYRRGSETRDLHDLSHSVEYYFRKNLSP